MQAPSGGDITDAVSIIGVVPIEISSTDGMMVALTWRKLPDRARSTEWPGKERRERELGDLVFPGPQTRGKEREKEGSMKSEGSQCMRGAGDLGGFTFWAGFQPLPFPIFIQ